MHIYLILGGFARLVILLIREKTFKIFNTLIVSILQDMISYIYTRYRIVNGSYNIAIICNNYFPSTFIMYICKNKIYNNDD